MGNVAIALAIIFVDSNATAHVIDVNRFRTSALLLLIGVLVFVAMTLFGWVEDLAAKRPVRLLPWSIGRADVETVLTRPRLPRWARLPDALQAKLTDLRGRGLLVTSTALLLTAVVLSWAFWPRGEPSATNGAAHLASSGIWQPGPDVAAESLTDSDDDGTDDDSVETPDEPDAGPPGQTVDPQTGGPASSSGGVDATHRDRRRRQ